jgi:lipopolysaccharide export system permease protein
MLGIFDRYVARETALTWAGVAGVLVLVVVVNRFAVYLGEAAGGAIPPGTSFLLIGLSVVGLLEIVLPVSLFLAAMLTLGRFYRDGEAVAAFVCGLTPARFYRPFVLLGLVAAGLLAWLALYASPWSAATGHRIEQQARAQAQVSVLVPGEFKQLANGGVFYAEASAQDGRELLDVFAQMEQQNDQAVVITAARGRFLVDAATGERRLQLDDGYRYRGTPGKLDWTVTRFRRSELLVSPGSPEPGATDLDRLSTAELARRGGPASRAALQWRLAQPLTVLVLLLLALPLAHTRPRQGRFARLVPAILVYLVYFNLLGVARVWVAQGQFPVLPGVWLVPILFALGGLVLMRQRFGRRPAPWRGRHAG